MRMLIDLTTQCLEDLNQSETGACINALLETSVEHSPHFDWVVAHIGGCLRAETFMELAMDVLELILLVLLRGS